VDYYVGGMEHATLHFLYARLFYRIIKNLGLIQNTALEPFKRVITQGLVLKDGAKMSKSKGNIVNPSTIIQTYGADCVRFAIVSAAPLWLDLEWQSAGLIGAFRFLNDLYKFCHDYSKFTKDSQYSAYKNSTVNMNKQQLLYENINLALEDIENLKFNTFASYCIKILHLLKTFSLQSDLLLIEEGLQILLSLLHPISPHVTQYLWYNLDFGDNILQNSFPNKKNCNAKIVKIIVQINGKFINTFDIDVQLTKEQMIAYIKEKCSKKLLKIVITQIVHIPNKIINFVSQK
jgi:leucyl-tRNA synthetase